MLKLAFLKIGELTDNLRHIRALLDYLKGKGVEVREYQLTQDNVQQVMDQLREFRPLFTLDVNATGIIVGEREGQKTPLYDLFGYVHMSFFAEDPMLHFPNLYGLSHNNLIAIVTDVKFADSLKLLGVQNLSYTAPFLDFSIFPEPSKDRDIELALLGPIIDPQIVLNASRQGIPNEIFPIFIETGEFMFRNPEINVHTALDYILGMFNPEIQEKFLKWRSENVETFFRMLNDISIYATMRKRWYIVNFLDGVNLKIIGDFQGQLKEDHEVIKVKDHNEALEIFGRTNLVILSFPYTVPSGIGYVPLEVSAMGCAPMVDFRRSVVDFFKPGEEIVTYTPLDRADIEEKVLYYLDNPQQAREIGERAREAVKQRCKVDDRGEFIYGMMKDIQQKALNQDQGGNSEAS